MRFATLAMIALTGAVVMLPVAAEACSGAQKSVSLPVQTAQAGVPTPAMSTAPAPSTVGSGQ
jgi:hypothetical protein